MIGLNIKDLIGGPGEVRTPDLMTASHARSQLRHRPDPSFTCIVHHRTPTRKYFIKDSSRMLEYNRQ